MNCDILCQSGKVGVLYMERQGLYSVFYGLVNKDMLTKVYGVFEKGECALGIPVPENGKMVLRTSVPTSKLPGGKLLYGKLYEDTDRWESFAGGRVNGILYPTGQRKGELLRFLWSVGDPFPAEEAALFYRYVQEGGKTYLELPLSCLRLQGKEEKS